MADSAASSRSARPSGGLRQMMRLHPLVAFFVMAYGFSWIVSIPAILSAWGVLPVAVFAVFFTIKSFGPFVAAYVVTGVIEGREGVRHLRRSLRQVRAGWQWYAFILLGIPALLLLGIAVLPGALSSFQGFPRGFVPTYLVTFVLIFFGGGPLGEEPGWRGFALPRLQARYGALRGTVLLGALWVFWHLPDYLTVAQRGGPGVNLATLLAVNLPIFFVMVMSMAVIFTWVFNHTRGSLFIAILLHTAINAFGLVMALFKAPIVTSTDLSICVAVAVPAVAIILLTQGRLGYQPAQEQPVGSVQGEVQGAS